MNKLLTSVGLAIALASASLVTGCQLYFGDRDEDGPRGPSTGGGPRPPGYACDTDAQCAAGCFCSADGTCDEAGFCKVDADCGTGFICDAARSSCKPAPSCATDGDCTAGSVCDPAAAACVNTCKCLNDSEAIEQGAGWCDETRGTCMTGVDPAGACLGAVTCAVGAPKCAEGEVALVKDGCYTGQCRAIAACEGAPVCGSLQHEDDCTARTADCGAIYIGRNCTGSTCGTGDPSDCRCESYPYSACEAKTPASPRTLITE